MTEKQRDMDFDYWFLRDNDVEGLTAIYILGIAYKENIVIIGLPRWDDPLKRFRRRKEK